MRTPLLLLFATSLLPAQAQITRPWVATYNGQGDYNDRFTCATRDAAGNLYLAGSVSNSDADRDWVVVKLNSAGAQQWRAELNGSGSGPDEVTAIAVNASGDVYVTGFARTVNTGTDFLTARYNSTGTLIWSQYYNNPAANGYDQANAIAIDGSNNVYITGQSDGDPTGAEVDDIATVKYANNGNQQWVQRYNGSGNGTDRPEGLGVDGSGNVYVSGRAWNGLDDDYVTLKYSTLGAQQWVQTVNRGGRDRASDLVLDASANVYITGRSFNGANEDFYTIKYSTAGVQQWAQAYDFGGDDRGIDMALDAAGNLYVAGHSDGDATLAGINWDYQVVAYTNAGTQLWQQRYNGATGQDDFPNAIATDGTAVYVTGEVDADATATVVTDVVTRSYAAATGALNWSTTFAAGAGLNDEGADVVAVPGAGCLVAGNKQVALPDREAIGLRYPATGVLSWQHITNAPGDNNENVRALRVDASNNVYAAGYSVESRMNRNMAVVKFSSTGAALCHYNLDGSSTGSADEAQGVELTATNDPVVAGYTKNSGESNDLTWFRMNATTCDTVWTRRLATAADGSDRVYDMTKDATGNFYVTGRTDTDPTFTANDDAYTAKFDAAGTLLWSANWTSAGVDEDRGSYLRVAASGNVYVTGRTWNGADFDIFLLKYNAAGVQQWVQVFSGGSGTDEPNGLVLDNAENAHIVGRAETATANVYNYIVLKYNASGVIQWSQPYDGTGGDDQGEGIVLDAGGNVYVTGFSDRDAAATEDMDIVTVKYSPAGVLLWAAAHDGPLSDKDLGDAIGLNSAGQVVVAGHVTAGTAAAPHYDAVLLVYDATGSRLYIDQYNTAGDGADTPALLTVKGSDTYVAGFTGTATTGRDMLVIKYSGSAPFVTVAPKVFLGGPFVSAAGTMTDGLRTAGLVPAQEPYTALGYAYTASGQAQLVPAVLATTGNNAIVDWVVVELRNSANPATVVASRAALVQRDGDVVGIDGSSALTFGVAPGNYRVAVRHRNHFGAMTAAAIALANAATTVDLTLPATATYGTNAQQTVGTVKALWPGNVLADTQIKYIGAGNDRDPVLTAIGGTVPTAVLAGYRNEDVNLDGTVKYVGAGNDRDPILVTVGGTTPNSVTIEQLP